MYERNFHTELQKPHLLYVHISILGKRRSIDSD